MTQALLVRAGTKACALAIENVVETMRPLPTEAVAGMPPFLRGLSVIRGSPAPVVDLAALIGGARSENVTRYVTLRVSERRVALAVDEVLGVQRLDGAALISLPPLLEQARADMVDALGALDNQLLLVLRAARIVAHEALRGLAEPCEESQG